MSRLVWTPEMKEIAKRDKKALVKLQSQLRYADGGNFSMVGPMDPDHAMMLWLFSTFRDEEKDHVIKAIGEVLTARTTNYSIIDKIAETLTCKQGECRRDDGYCTDLGFCVYEKCEHGRFYAEVCDPCERSGEA